MGSDLEQNSSSTSKEAINGGREVGSQSLVTKSILEPISSEDEAQCLEIFEVRVSYHGRKTSGKIHGTVYCDSSMGIRDLYRRNKAHAESVSFPVSLHFPFLSLFFLPFPCYFLRASDFNLIPGFE